MIRFIVRRLLGAVVVVWVVSLVTFAVFQLAPKLSGQSPIYYYIAKQPPPVGSVQYKELLHAYGFDRSLPAQYWKWLTDIFHTHTLTNGGGESNLCHVPCLGYSFKLHTPVTSLIMSALPVTVSLAIGASILWLFFGLLVGTISGLRPNSIFDRAGMVTTLSAVSLPVFFTGPVFLLLFVYKWKWLVNVDYASITDDPVQWLRSMILPWITLALTFAALYARLTRANMMETMNEDFIRTARAKGLRERKVVVRHGLRAALTPIVTIFGIDLGTLIGSTVITENVFNLRGIGYLTIQAISTKDLPVILGVTVIAAIALVVANVIVDVLYAVVDPRVKY
ncbi:MAG: ABC transporter permease [Jatrophihabitans sp.]|uniref:ABC transporter permease n=1 Tax=Jatrophihabitans sp. TaxID=1932789 RepID=UPI003F7CD892